MENKDNFGTRLKKLRHAKGMSQADLAHKLFESPSMVGKWENKNETPRSEATVRMLCLILDTTPDYLYGFDEGMDANRRRRIAMDIVEAFENTLIRKGIEIPCKDAFEEHSRHDDGNDAAIYGTEYGDLIERVAGLLNA